MTLKILVNAIGKRLQFARLLQERCAAQGASVCFADASATAPGLLKFGGVTSPLMSDPDYAARWGEIFAQEGITHVLSIIDTDQVALREVAEACGVGFLGPSRAVLETCQDKLAFHDALVAADVPTVPSQDGPLTAGAFISKDRFGSCGSNVLFHEAGEAVAAAAVPRIFQPRVSGTHIDVDFIYDGTTLLMTLKEITAKEAGESYAMEMIHDPDVAALVRRLVEALEYRGVGNADIWRHGDDWQVMEINPRYGGNAPASVMAGCDLMTAQLALAATGRIAPADTPSDPTYGGARFVKSFVLEEY